MPLIQVNNRAQLLASKAQPWASLLQAMRASLLTSASAAAGSPVTNSRATLEEVTALQEGFLITGEVHSQSPAWGPVVQVAVLHTSTVGIRSNGMTAACRMLLFAIGERRNCSGTPYARF